MGEALYILSIPLVPCFLLPCFWLQVKLGGMSFIGLSTVVNFLYSGELPLDGGNIDYVLEAAHFLQVTIHSAHAKSTRLDLIQLTQSPKTRPVISEGNPFYITSCIYVNKHRLCLILKGFF